VHSDRETRRPCHARFAHIGVLALLLLSQDWKRVEHGLALTYPKDHGAHLEYRTEWWYLTGNLDGPAGERFGFQFTIFRSGLDPSAAEAGDSPLRVHHVYAGHLALTDVAAGRTRFAERLRRSGAGLARAAEDELDLALDDWTLRRDANDHLHLAASDPAQGFGFAFELAPEKPLVLHGDAGVSTKGPEPGNASAYASWTRIDTTGTLTVDGRELIVRGAAWYDHEFGSSVLPDGVRGWDWFSLQLDDGRELVLFALRREDGTPTEQSAGTLVERDGSARTLARDDFRIEVQGRWKSPRSGGAYPARWTIEVPGEALRLELAPLVSDCELSSAATGVVYWEGPVAITGSTSGRGYAELTGYSNSMSKRF